MESWGPAEWVEVTRGVLDSLALKGIPFIVVMAVGITAIRHGWPWCGRKEK